MCMLMFCKADVLRAMYPTVVAPGTPTTSTGNGAGSCNKGQVTYTTGRVLVPGYCNEDALISASCSGNFAAFSVSVSVACATVYKHLQID